MLKLAFSGALNQGLKPRVKLALYAVPFVCLMLSFVPTFYVGASLADYLGIAQDMPVRDQQHGLLWGAAFLTVAVVNMLVGYAVGWLLNAYGAALLLRWPWDRVHAVFADGEIPANWRIEVDEWR
ncbi:MAG: hypothetical protein QNJ00_05090 [Woeseiaceae bacterium]|nr:hypothetical protein [Woeseiaceae bacterium]